MTATSTGADLKLRDLSPTEPSHECGGCQQVLGADLFVCPTCGFLNCKRCGLESPPGTERCPGCKTFLPRNSMTGLRDHGKTTGERLPADLRVSVEDWRSGLVSAMGGLEALDGDPILAGRVRLIVDLEIVLRLARQQIGREGIANARGRYAVDQLLRTSVVWLNTSEKIGAGRRQRRVTGRTATRDDIRQRLAALPVVDVEAST